ncbi:MAG: monosaccharide transporter substrate-binding protein family [Chthonomonadaceae bacterium]|nr:monosaccharide transporter substrate-binding protein family [Chthonomonadaceae bacterium]
MRNWMRYGGLMAATALSLTTLGCPKDTATPPADNGASGPKTSGSTPTAGKKIKVAVIVKGTANSFWKTMEAGADAAGKEDNVEILFAGPTPEGDIQNQINLIQTQITNQVDGLVIAATDTNAIVKPVQEAAKKGIPVVMVDSGISDTTTPVCYIATDNVKGGQVAAENLAKAIGEKGNVALLGIAKGSASSDQRDQGFIDGIKKYPNIHLVATQYTQNKVETAVDQLTNILTAHPDIVGVFATSEANGVGAANALKQRKLNGKITLIAFDSSKEEVAALEDGTILALMVQDPYQMGYKGVKTIEQALKKEPIAAKTMDSGLKVVTKQNMAEPDIAKLLPPK